MKTTQVIRTFAIFAVLFFTSCGPVNPTYPKDTADCKAACVHLKEMKCAEGDDLPDGTTCQKFCENTQNSGHALKPSCVLKTSDCDVFRATCGQL